MESSSTGVLASDRLGSLDETRRRIIPVAPGEPVPHIGECAVLAFEADASRWTIEQGRCRRDDFDLLSHLRNAA